MTVEVSSFGIYIKVFWQVWGLKITAWLQTNFTVIHERFLDGEKQFPLSVITLSILNKKGLRRQHGNEYHLYDLHDAEKWRRRLFKSNNIYQEKYSVADVSVIHTRAKNCRQICHVTLKIIILRENNKWNLSRCQLYEHIWGGKWGKSIHLTRVASFLWVALIFVDS